MELQNNDYSYLMQDMKMRIRSSQIIAYKKVNNELIQLYLDLGKILYEKQKENGWGAKILEHISSDLIQEFGNNSGYSIRNLKYIVAFYKTYREYPKVQQLVAQIPWGQNLTILDKCKTIEERKFYRIFAEKENWSKRELKTTKFKAEYVGQVNKYLSYLNKNKKKSFENHPIGLILCKEASKETVEFALDGLEEKMKVAVYKSLPSQSILQEQIRKIENKLKK